MVPLIHILAFCGGFVIMSMELLGGRILAPTGSGVMSGAALSPYSCCHRQWATCWVAGFRCETRHRAFCRHLPWRDFAVSADTVCRARDGVYLLRIEDSRYGSLVASAFLFILPTVILGMISPYSVRLLVTKVEESGKVAGTLYFVSTLGCDWDADDVVLFYFVV